jgi:hypothetical protein
MRWSIVLLVLAACGEEGLPLCEEGAAGTDCRQSPPPFCDEMPMAAAGCDDPCWSCGDSWKSWLECDLGPRVACDGLDCDAAYWQVRAYCAGDTDWQSAAEE